MQLTLKPMVIHGQTQKATFDLTINYDEDLKNEQTQETNCVRSFGAMHSYDLLVKARIRANAFLTKHDLKLNKDDSDIINGVRMIVYHDIAFKELENLLEPRPVILTESSLQEFDIRN